MTDQPNNMTSKAAREANRGFAEALADPAAAFARDFPALTIRVETVMCGNDLHDEDFVAYVVRSDDRCYAIFLTYEEASVWFGEFVLGQKS